MNRPPHSQQTPPRWHDIRAQAQAHATEALAVIVELMKGAKDERLRLAAAEAILVRAWGRASDAPTISKMETHERNRERDIAEREVAERDVQAEREARAK